MTKKEFLEKLKNSLSALSESDRDERLNFYGEMIDDRIEEGYSEEEAVKTVGNPEEIGSQIASEYSSIRKSDKKEKTKRKWQTWQIVLVCAGFPVWLPLLVSAFVVIIALAASFWAVVGAIWSLPVSASACALAGFILPAVYFIQGNILGGIAIIGVGLICAGLAIFSFYGCIKATKGGVILIKKTFLWIRALFVAK